MGFIRRRRAPLLFGMATTELMCPKAGAGRCDERQQIKALATIADGQLVDLVAVLLEFLADALDGDESVEIEPSSCRRGQDLLNYMRIASAAGAAEAASTRRSATRTFATRCGTGALRAQPGRVSDREAAFITKYWPTHNTFQTGAGFRWCGAALDEPQQVALLRRGVSSSSATGGGKIREAAGRIVRIIVHYTALVSGRRTFARRWTSGTPTPARVPSSDVRQSECLWSHRLQVDPQHGEAVGTASTQPARPR